MPSLLSPLNRIQRAVLILIGLWLALVVGGVNLNMAERQATSESPLPFGIVSANGNLSGQDFAYNMLYLEGIRDHLVAHPYRLDDQEKIMRTLLPGATSGVSHAYSPVTFVLARPLLGLPGQARFALYTVICALGILLLFYLALLPKAQDPLQLVALACCAVSLWVMTSFLVGQTSILTTTFVGLFWWLLSRCQAPRSLVMDGMIALLFWAACMKPSVAIIPFMLLVGARAWRPLGLALVLLGVTWIFTAGFYGGFVTGLMDYSYLLDHYNNADFTPFMRRAAETPEGEVWGRFWFALERNLILLSGATLILLRWLGKITASEQFQGMVWTFLLFSPYLLPSENWILCLLVVEGAFFCSSGKLLNYGKILLLAAILDLRAEMNFPVQIEYPLKWVLVAWILVEWALRSKNPTRSPV